MVSIKSKDRVSKFGEVFTPAWMVDEMLQLVRPSVLEADFRVFEPACGTGNFLIRIAELRMKKIQDELIDGEPKFPRVLRAMRSLFGVELLDDNVAECRSGLVQVALKCLSSNVSKDQERAIKLIVDQNIVCGNARSLMDERGEPLLIPVWDIDDSGNGAVTYFELNQLFDRSFPKESLFDAEFQDQNINPVRQLRLERFSLRDSENSSDPHNVKGVEKSFGFDLIVGNPPYQEPDSGFGNSAVPVYQEFVEDAINIGPKYVVMVIPSRWFVGGKGLDNFRNRMISDSRVSHLIDFPDSNLVFKGTQIKGGVCYFLWDRDFDGPCSVTSRLELSRGSTSVRYLREPGADIFIRFELGLRILQKVLKAENTGGLDNGRLELKIGRRFSEIVSPRKPFGLDTQFRGEPQGGEGLLPVFRRGGIGYAAEEKFFKSHFLLSGWKVLVPRASSGFDGFPHQIIGQPLIAPPGTACSETYIVIGPYKSEKLAEASVAYIRTKFFRFLCLLSKAGQDTPRNVFRFVPRNPGSETITDTALYDHYKLDREEISFIESLVAPYE